MTRFIRWWSLTLLMLGALPLQAAEPVVIGVSLGLTGEYALTSGMQKNAYELFEDDLNETGGILGRPARFIILDNESDPATAARQYEQLIVRDQVDFVIGPYTSGLTMAIAPVVEKHGYPTLAAGAAADRIWQQGYKNIFGMWTPASKYVLGFLKLLVAYKLDNITIVTGDGPFAANLATGARKWAKALRLNVIDYITFPEGKSDFLDIARRVAATEPDVVICTGHYYVGAGMKRAFAQLRWQPKIFYATVGPTFQRYADEFQQSAELDFSTAIWEPHPRLKYPGSVVFVQRYLERFGQPPSYHAASAYAAGEVLVMAITEAQTLDRDVIRETLQSMSTITILGRYAVDRTGMQIKRFPLIIQWQGGQKEIVWPPELQTMAPEFREK